MEEHRTAVAAASRDSIGVPSIAHLLKTNPREWARQFRAWADGHDPEIPVLSDEAMSRESIYPDLA
jgi:hypothetical protein